MKHGRMTKTRQMYLIVIRVHGAKRLQNLLLRAGVLVVTRQAASADGTRPASHYYSRVALTASQAETIARLFDEDEVCATPAQPGRLLETLKDRGLETVEI